MSRHRAVREMAKSRDYEDELDDDDDDLGTSPASPSASQYLYNRAKPAPKPAGLGAFMAPAGAAKPAPRTAGFDVKPSAPASTYAASHPPPGLARPAPANAPVAPATTAAPAPAHDAELLTQCLSAIHAVLGDSHAFSADALADAARRANYDAGAAISRLLDGASGAAPSTPTPKVGAPVSLSGNAESLPLSSPAPPSPSSASLPAASDAPAARPLMGAFVRPAFGGKRAAHPSAKLSPAPAAAAAPPAAPAAVAPSQPQVEPPPLAAPPPPSSPAEAAWPAGFPSLFGRLLCAAPERGAQAAAASVAASFSWSAWQAGGAARFAFDTPLDDFAERATSPSEVSVVASPRQKRQKRRNKDDGQRRPGKRSDLR